jgi:C1A family cysteine protease
MFRKYTYIKKEPTHNFTTIEKLSFTKPLYTSYSLSKYLPPIVTQGELGACTACSLICALNIIQRVKKYKNILNYSILFLYYIERKEYGTEMIDSGSSLSTGITCLQNTGVCQNKYWPYNILKYNIKPPKICYTNASKYKISNNIIQVPNDVESIKKILRNKIPIVIGIMVYSSFENVSVSGIISYPNKLEEPLLGGHAMCMYGYDDTNQYFILRNSWGPLWGDRGTGYLPYQYASDPELTLEMWAITSFKN